MSLRVFHVIFIVCSVVLCLYVGLWGIREYATARDGRGLAMGVVFLATGAALVVYGKRTFHKLRDLP